MSTASAKSTVRPGGGVRPIGGTFDEEYLEKDAMSAVQQTKTNAQQGAQPGPTPQAQAAKAAQNKPVRPVGSITDEVKYFAQDVVQEVKDLFSLTRVLDIKSSDTPEEQAKKKQQLQRFNKLTQEEQEWAKQRYQEEMQKKQAEEQQKQRQKQLKEQQEAASIAPPSSPAKGPIGPGGRKQKTHAQLTKSVQTEVTSLDKVAGGH